ncbi:hypothetical protein [Raoultella terrigena]|uniref:hypothetical protein n=1 Tax=Raoultella terrigena TaxID=577 RepID=UPI0011E59593|nr:hypothetical protein [Raoultella terrigena]
MQHLSTGNVGAHSSGLMFRNDETFLVMDEYNILLNENNYYYYLQWDGFLEEGKAGSSGGQIGRWLLFAAGLKIARPPISLLGASTLKDTMS